MVGSRILTTEPAVDDDERLDAFIAEAARSFEFLCDRHGFSAPRSEINRAAATVTVTFAKGSVGIEAIHDLREGDVEVKVARLESGRKPEGYHVDQRGKRCRASLLEILMKRGVRDFGLKPPDAREEPEQRVRLLLSRYADLRQEHAPDTLAGSTEPLEQL